MVETLTADRAERAADLADRAADRADRRARDADRSSRWMVGIGLALVAAILITLLDLRADVNGLTDDMTAVRVALVALVAD